MADAKTETQTVPMKVWRPDGTTIKVSTIASHEAHLGNRIAEGDMNQDDYYPELTAYYRQRSRKAEQQLYDQRQALEKAAYRADWVQRWLMQEENPDHG